MLSTLALGLQDTTLALDFRVSVLEKNGGSDGNSSVAELEVRVESLKGTAADHETRISATKSDVTGNSVEHYVINDSNQNGIKNGKCFFIRNENK